jgi:hypothetical protein
VHTAAFKDDGHVADLADALFWGFPQVAKG